ncbi:MAG: acetate kinase [Clostridia bacterium]|nr:acetate kinase [Clostridia bacterium]
MKILVVNAGSSSLKYQLIDMKDETVIAKGICERIGDTGAISHKTFDDRKYSADIPMPNHTVAFNCVVDALTSKEYGVIESMSEISAVGHRVVQGGSIFDRSVIVDEKVIEDIYNLAELAPLHNKAHVQGIRACIECLGNEVPQVVVFDTAFHQTMPAKSYMYPIPYEMYEKYKIRRYGFHGTSHRFVSGVMTDILGKVEGTKIVTCHLGNGSSISAVKDGKVIDTTMGFTPLAGVEMGTRCGDVDPAVVTFIMEKEGFTPDEMSNFMNKKCGFLGVTSGYSSDSRDLEDAIAAGPSNPHYEKSKLAVDILIQDVKKYIGSYAAEMNGLDAIVFTAGLGENNTHLREEVCSNMEYFGIEIDREINEKTLRQSNIVKISTDNSKVAVYVIPTNEELVIARDTLALISK